MARVAALRRSDGDGAPVEGRQRKYLMIELQGEDDEELREALRAEADRRERSMNWLAKKILHYAIREGYLKKLPIN